MTRRTLTALLGVALAIALAAAGVLTRVPYVILSPGPAFNTLGTVGTVGPDATTQVLTVSGHKTYATEGALDATTVSVTDGVNLFDALSAWFSGSEAVVPRELVYPPGQTQQQTDKQNQQDMQQSQDDAVIAALHELGIKGTTQVVVDAVTANGPSDGHLKKGDVLVSVDGQPVGGVTSLRALISRRTAGAPVTIGYRRAGEPGTTTLTTIASRDVSHRPLIGIMLTTHADFPVHVDIKLRDVGGPSAGLMFALGIIDKLEPGSLTGGRTVAGTGEITAEGKVGAIGGIAQKMRGALAAGASVFLVPAANCAEARRSRPDGLTLVRVATLKDALAGLTAVRAGRAAPTC